MPTAVNCLAKGKEQLIKKSLLFGIASIVTIFVICILSFKLMTDGCIGIYCVEETDFSVYELDIPDTYFPVDSTINKLLPLSEPMGAQEAVNKTVYWGEYGIAVYNIHSFKSINRATSMFNALQNDASRFRSHKDVNYSGQKADQYFSGCGFSEFGGYRCAAFIRYEGLVISLSARTDSQMTEEKFNRVVKFVDELLSQRYD